MFSTSCWDISLLLLPHQSTSSWTAFSVRNIKIISFIWRKWRSLWKGQEHTDLSELPRLLGWADFWPALGILYICFNACSAKPHLPKKLNSWEERFLCSNRTGFCQKLVMLKLHKFFVRSLLPGELDHFKKDWSSRSYFVLNNWALNESFGLQETPN